MNTQRFQMLIERMRAGSNDAAWELVQVYGPHVQAIVRRRLNPGVRRAFDSEDFVQVAWASLFRIIPRIKDLHEPRQLIALMATIACRRLSTEASKPRHVVSEDKSASERDPQKVLDANPGPDATPSQYAMARECWSNIVSKLSKEHQEVVQLRLRGLTFEEIAKRTGLHERTTRRVIERVMQQTEETK